MGKLVDKRTCMYPKWTSSLKILGLASPEVGTIVAIVFSITETAPYSTMSLICLRILYGHSNLNSDAYPHS